MWIVWFGLALIAAYLEYLGCFNEFSVWDNLEWILLVSWLIWAFKPAFEKKKKDQHTPDEYGLTPYELEMMSNEKAARETEAKKAKALARAERNRINWKTMRKHLSQFSKKSYWKRMAEWNLGPAPMKSSSKRRAKRTRVT